MTERERLQNLISDAFSEYSKTNRAQFKKTFVADYLLACGVVVPPCKVGDTVYHLKNIYKGKRRIGTVIELLVVDSFVIGDLGRVLVNVCDNSENEWFYYDSADFGKTIFLTRKEADRALKEEISDNE